MAAPTIVSASGKVLIAGGYLVLDPAYPGVVVSTSSRFYSVIQDKSSLGAAKIQVRSPQFESSTWDYTVSFEPAVLVEAASTNTSKNKFVHLALQKTIALAVEIKGVEAVKSVLSTGIDIAIVGNNDFYSQRAKLAELNLPRTLESLEQIPPFTPTGVRLADVHKTGLGSSAALITSLVSGLLVHLSAISPEALSDVTHKDRYLAHNAAQFIHCLAQGKIGSGFDVSAAVFGSHLYTRFDPAVIQDLMSDDSTKELLPILSPSNPGWTYKVEPFQLPPQTRLMLADVDAGSDTPSLVGQVLKWRKDDSAKALDVWTTLDTLNQSLAKALLSISDLALQDSISYSEAIKHLASVTSDKWVSDATKPVGIMNVVSAFKQAHEITQSIRGKMVEMGSLAGVPIEPAEQTRLLDACVSQPGVVGGGVPGAGGYDAIWLLVLDPPTSQAPVEGIQKVWSTYTELDVSPLSAVESLAKGIRLETLDDVKGLQTAISL